MPILHLQSFCGHTTQLSSSLGKRTDASDRIGLPAPGTLLTRLPISPHRETVVFSWAFAPDTAAGQRETRTPLPWHPVNLKTLC